MAKEPKTAAPNPNASGDPPADDKKDKKPTEGDPPKDEKKPKDGDPPKNDGDDDDPPAEGDGEKKDGDDEDWRVRWAGGDAEILEELKRYDSEESVARALVLAKKKAREKGGIQPPKADAPVEEKAKFYTEHFGRPEKAEDIKLEPSIPDGETLTEAEATTLKGVATLAHQAGIFGAEQIAAIAQITADLAIGGRKEQDKIAEKVRETTRTALAKAWGKDAEANEALAVSYMSMRSAQAGVDRVALANVRLSDGSLLGDNELFMKVMALGGRDHAEDPLMDREETGGAKAADLQKQLDDEMAKRNGSAADRKYYDSDAAKKKREKLRSDMKRLGGGKKTPPKR